MVRVLIFLCFLSSISTRLLAQNYEITAYLYDSLLQQPIVGCHIESSYDTVLSNEKGFFSIKSDSFITLSHLSYGLIELQDVVNLPDTLWLQSTAYTIEEFVVGAERKITKVSPSDNYRIKDFYLYRGAYLLVQEKKFTSKKNRLVLFNLEGEELSSLTLNHTFKNLISTCLDHFFITDDTHAYLIDVELNMLVLKEKYRITEIEETFGSCIDYINGVWLLEHAKREEFSSEYFLARGENPFTIKRFTNPALRSLYENVRSEIAEGQAIHNMSDITTNENRIIRNKQWDSDYYTQVVFNPKDKNTGLLTDEKCYIFNNQLDSLHIFSHSGALLYEEELSISNSDYFFADYEGKNCFLLRKNGHDQFELQLFLPENTFIKTVSITASSIRKAAITKNKIFYLRTLRVGNIHKLEMCIEEISTMN